MGLKNLLSNQFVTVPPLTIPQNHYNRDRKTSSLNKYYLSVMTD